MANYNPTLDFDGDTAEDGWEAAHGCNPAVNDVPCWAGKSEAAVVASARLFCSKGAPLGGGALVPIDFSDPGPNKAGGAPVACP